MSPLLVLDASATIACFFEEQPAADAINPLLDSYDLIAPTLWALELINNVVVRQRRKNGLSEAEAAKVLRTIDEFPIDLKPQPMDQSATQLGRFAVSYELSAYDATYLDLAIRHNAPLCSIDKALRRAAERAGVEVLPATLPQQ